MHKILLFITLFLFLACSSEKPAEKAVQKPSDAGKGAISKPVQLPVSGSKDAVKADAKKVKNTPPELSRVKILPEVFKPGDTLYVDAAASDAEEDEVTILYEWTKNGEPAGKEKKIDVPIKRGDKVSIKITPYDGKDYGNSIVLHREIGNMPPMIIGNKNKKSDFDGKVFTYQVKAADADNDPLTYSLKAAPSGMTIEKTTGLIKWDVPQTFKGRVSVTVIVNDGHGGESTYTFAFSIEPEK